MNKQICVFIFFIFSWEFSICQASLETNPQRIAESFLEAMRTDGDLKTFISPTFISENGAINKPVNVFLVDRYKVKEKSPLVYAVEIDHGKGAFCTVIVLRVVKENNTFYILPSGIEKGTLNLPEIFFKKIDENNYEMEYSQGKLIGEILSIDDNYMNDDVE